MPEITWVDGLARARGKVSVDAYVHVPGPLLGEFLQALRRGEWVAGDCGEHLLLPPRNPCPDGRAPARLVNLGRDIDWVVEVAVEVGDAGSQHVMILARPLVEGVMGGVFHRLCSGETGETGSLAGVRARPLLKPAEERKGSLDDIMCFEIVR